MELRAFIRYVRKAYETWNVIAESLGWRRSFRLGRPLDADGNAIPWYTYPAIEFLRTLDLKDCRVFEYGCGNSSLFWASRVREVFSAETDPAWASEIRAKNTDNLTVLVAEEKAAYVEIARAVGGRFDIFVVDGRHRYECAEVASQLTVAGGMIIFDNADWYPEACELLRSRGWSQIDFSGLGPINPYAWTTAVFVRSLLEIRRGTFDGPAGGNPLGRFSGNLIQAGGNFLNSK